MSGEEGFALKRLAQLEESLGRSRAEIAATLLAELDRAFAELEPAIAQGRLEAAGLAAHTARSSALMLDAEGLLSALAQVEAAARAADAPGAEAGLARALAAWAVVRPQLAAG